MTKGESTPGNERGDDPGEPEAGLLRRVPAGTWVLVAGILLMGGMLTTVLAVVFLLDISP